MKPCRGIGHEGLSHGLARHKKVRVGLVCKRAKRDVKGQRLVPFVDVRRVRTGHKRMDVGSIGADGDPISKRFARAPRRKAGEVGDREEKPAQSDRATGIANIGELRKPVARSEHSSRQRDLLRGYPSWCVLFEPAVPGQGTQLGGSDDREVDAALPVVSLLNCVSLRLEKIAEWVVVSTLFEPLRITPVLQAEIAGWRLLTGVLDPAVRPDQLPGVGL